MICLFDKDAITWKESLVDKRCDLLLQHLGEEATSNQATKLGVFGYGAMQFGYVGLQFLVEGFKEDG
jgi:hypothetical protein